MGRAPTTCLSFDQACALERLMHRAHRWPCSVGIDPMQMGDDFLRAEVGKFPFDLKDRLADLRLDPMTTAQRSTTAIGESGPPLRLLSRQEFVARLASAREL